MGGSISIRNQTYLPLIISLQQITPLYWQIIQPGQLFYKQTGAVHFTIKAYVACLDHINVFRDCVLPITAVSVGAISMLGVGLVSIGATAGILGVGEVFAVSVANNAVQVGNLYASELRQEIVKSTMQAIQMVLSQSNDQALQVINSDFLKSLPQSIRKQHVRVKKCGYYAGYNHNLKIFGGINMQKLENGQYQATQLRLIKQQ